MIATEVAATIITFPVSWSRSRLSALSIRVSTREQWRAACLFLKQHPSIKVRAEYYSDGVRQLSAADITPRSGQGWNSRILGHVRVAPEHYEWLSRERFRRWLYFTGPGWCECHGAYLGRCRRCESEGWPR